MPRSNPLLSGAALKATLERPVDALAGIGPVRLARLRARLGTDARVRDVLVTPPSRLDEVSPTPSAAGPTGAVVRRFQASGAASRFGRGGLALAGTADGRPLRLRWFRPPPAALVQRLLAQGPHLVHGVVRRAADGMDVLDHPRLLAGADVGSLLPHYAGLDGSLARIVRKAVATVAADWPDDLDWLPANRRDEFGLPAPGAALAILHGVRRGDDALARRRLALDEWLAVRLDLAAARMALGRATRPLRIAGRLAAALERALPFAATASQRAAHAAVRADLVAGRRMTRLLNGDVGSGKTLVAALAAADVIEAGRQVALIAPSEALTSQHAATFDGWLRPLGVTVGLLSGTVRGAARRQLLARVADGTVQLLVATQALLEDAVAFADLGLVVVDEQHRFGVRQRLGLAAKGAEVHLLAMTATPIPRTLALALGGEVAVSYLQRRAGQGTNVATRVVAMDRLEAVVERLATVVEQGARAFWVMPSIDGTDRDAGAAARHAHLQARLPGRVALLTSRTDAPDRTAALAAFRSGTCPVLVATTVVEVGIDVPDASIMVIEGAEAFGLAQLHQLRGRVGRGGQPASCVLLCASTLTPAQVARLELMRREHDGLVLAEADLRQRGSGEALGLRQSGNAGFRLLDWSVHGAWLAQIAADLPPPALDRFDPRWLFAGQPATAGGLVGG